MSMIEVNGRGIVFCRVTTVVLLAISMLAQSKPLVVVVVLLMAIPAALTVRYAPIYLFYNRFLSGILGVKPMSVDVPAIRFAQGFGAFLLLCAVANFYVWHSDTSGWVLVGIVAGSTAFGAAGYCMGAYMYYGLRWMIRLFMPKAANRT
jgi:hypothetical protein